MIDWLARAEAQKDEMIAQRRDFHRHPELAFEEFRTAGIVAQSLTALGLEVQSGVGKTGVVGILEGATDGPTVMLRCDMDALPVIEDNQTDYNSGSAGKMHACGHDGHTAIGLAVAKMLTEERHKIAGRVKFVFQPAEEIARGAQAMIDDGVLTNPAPDVAIGLHLWNELPLGEVSVTQGSAMAGAADWDITIRGKGGHAGMPHLTSDPVVAGAQIVTALQSIVARNVSPIDTAVISTTVFRAGDAHNVIPSEVHLAGTYRTYLPATRDHVNQRLNEVAIGIATAMGCTAEVKTVELTPPLINDPEVNARLRKAFNQLGSSLKFVDNSRTMAAEDMAVFLEKIPGTFFFVGSANASKGLNFPHHHPQFDFDEDALPTAAGLLAAAAAEYVIRD